MIAWYVSSSLHSIVPLLKWVGHHSIPVYCPGVNGNATCMKSNLELTAGGLQIDSFCQDSTHPVILHALSNVGTHRPKQSNTTGFAVSLQVCAVLLLLFCCCCIPFAAPVAASVTAPSCRATIGQLVLVLLECCFGGLAFAVAAFVIAVHKFVFSQLTSCHAS